MATEDRIITDDEIRQLARQLCKGTGKPVPEADVKRVVDWATDTRIESSLLELLLRGKICVRIKDGELFFALDPDVTGREFRSPDGTIADIERFLGQQRRNPHQAT